MPFKLLRNGYLEECFFDFHLTPIKDENGKVVGIMDAGYENTSQVLYVLFIIIILLYYHYYLIFNNI